MAGLKKIGKRYAGNSLESKQLQVACCAPFLSRHVFAVQVTQTLKHFFLHLSWEQEHTHVPKCSQGTKTRRNELSCLTSLTKQEAELEMET